VRALLVEDGGAAARPEEGGVTPLHWAAINDRGPVVALLLDHGAEPDARGGQLGATPLHWAASRGAAGAALQLLARGAAAHQADG
jgi:palmitoyltransferase